MRNFNIGSFLSLAGFVLLASGCNGVGLQGSGVSADVINQPGTDSVANVGTTNTDVPTTPGTVDTPTNPPPTPVPPVVVNPPAPPSTCTINTTTSSAITKVLFVMDDSGSNASGQDGKGDGTDPKKVWRERVVSDFVAKYKSNPSIYYGLISFSNKKAVTYVKTNKVAGFTNDADQMNQVAIPSFLKSKDEGGTNYQVAFDAASNIINADIAANRLAKIGYVVVFLSDGGPQDFTKSITPVIFTSQNESDLQKAVDRVLAPAPDRITVNSVFYYNTNYSMIDPGAVKVMAAVAKDGRGIASVADSSTAIDISNEIVIPDQNCPLKK